MERLRNRLGNYFRLNAGLVIVFIVFVTVFIIMGWIGQVMIVYETNHRRLYAERKCSDTVDLTLREYRFMPIYHSDYWHINDKGYIFTKKLVKNCKICFTISEESYFAFSTWDPKNSIKRKHLPIVLDGVVHINGGSDVFKRKDFCIVANDELYFRLQHSFNKPKDFKPKSFKL